MPKIEKAYYATTLKAVRDAPPGFSRVYYGAEFCQWRMPGPASAMKAYGAAVEAGLGFTLMTPWLTDAGLRKVSEVLSAIGGMRRDCRTPLEVVVNDFGLLAHVKEKRLRVTPVLGRLLVKQKCCPRVPAAMKDMPPAGREVYVHAGVDDPVAAGFLRRWGVRRVELDNPLQGVEVNLRGVRLKGSIYTPYAYVTTTRHCPASFDGETWGSLGGCRDKACRDNVLSLSNPAHESALIMRGNTQFVHNPGPPEGLAGMGIDRVVFMPEAP